MDFDDEISSIPLFDNILTNSEGNVDPRQLLRTPRKSPTKINRLQDIGKLDTFSYSTPSKLKDDETSEVTTPKSSLKSYASQTNLDRSSKSNSPEKILFSYNKLLNESKDYESINSPKKKISPARKLSFSPFSPSSKSTSTSSISSSPSKGGTFMERRQMLLNKKRMPQKSKSEVSLNNNDNNYRNSFPTTPVKKDKVLKKLDFFSSPTTNDSLKTSPKRKIHEIKRFDHMLTPQSLQKHTSNVKEEKDDDDHEGSPKKKQKSPSKNINENGKKKLIFEDNDDEEEIETKVKNKNLISKETIDHIMFKQHMIMKHEFGVGLNANKFDPKFDSPHLISRDDEYQFMINHLQNKLSRNESFVADCLVIVGPPGTGKSKQIWQLLQYHYLKELLEFKPTKDVNRENGNFKKVYCSLINCMAYLTVGQILETISNSLTLKAKTIFKFNDLTSFDMFLKKTDLTIVLIMDEMDKFVHKHKDDLYKLIDLARKYQNFIIVSITNSFEIGNISSDFKLNQLLVKPYSTQQISDIITKKLEKVKEKMVLSIKEELPSFDSENLSNMQLIQKSSLMLICKKFGTQSGDLRDVTNFIYQILEIRESKALMQENINMISKQGEKEVALDQQAETVYHQLKNNKEMSEYILNHWSLKPIDSKTVIDVFKLSSDNFNIQKLLNKLNIWQQLILLILCKLIHAEQEKQLFSKEIQDIQQFNGILYHESYSCYLKFMKTMKIEFSKKGNSYSLLLENDVSNNEFIKIIELLEANGIINKYKFKKDFYLLIRYDYETIYQLLNHNSLLKDCIDFNV
ncbi:hypothetical protein HANVADRAFT_51163 [Hanseniaspora valbyensis NRRL Y-1626]|uniref:ORC1/DEAH AAA+ ATPase domain-containing protein n=1 Tax=Hanseniaspora valbyensis NRRL Y-1626 TaxID=766949 RepID=A0A1B7TIW0_9ASCO|nr:hypothetical protein HANVADRAFT_51163 [Hanseniaspora valbyensis NRRL Y-1626]